MKVKIVSPTKAILENFTQNQIEKVKTRLTYTNTSISFQIKKIKENRWWKRSNPITWEEAILDLEKKQKSCLLNEDSSGYWIRPGSVPYLFSEDIVENQITYPGLKPLQWKIKPKFKPYEYQQKCIENLISVRHGNVEIPTGGGKTLVLLTIAQLMGLDTVIVTPSASIFNEILEDFQYRLGKNVVGGYGDGKKDISKKITVAIGKSLTMLKPGTEAYDFFKNKKVMLIDEAHSFAAEQLDDVCHGVLSEIPYRMFVSATQTRNDGTERVLESIIGRRVFEMGLKEAIDKNYLCPLKFAVIPVTSPSNKITRDPTDCKRVHFLYNQNIAETIAKMSNAFWNVKQESTLILVDELRQIEMLASLLKVPFSYVHSAARAKASEFNLDTVKSKEQVLRFNKGEVKVLIGTKAIATGTNIFPTHNTINWMGGSSEIVTKQGTMGRSTRKLENSDFADLHIPKPYSKIYDFSIKIPEGCSDGLKKTLNMLNNQLKKRVGFYEETGSSVKFL